VKNLYRISGFLTYFLIVFLNAFVDLGHKIVLQNTVFKTYDGTELMVLTAIINALILLPFVFLFSPSGFISDKYCKTKIVRVSSFIAIIITSLITLSYYLGYFEMAFVATLLLAAQSAFYSPAKYGLIKEMFGTGNVVKANSITQAITIIAILLGAVIYSIFFESLLIGDVNNKDEILKMVAPIGFVLIISSVFEFLLSLKLPITNAKKITDNFAIKKYLTGGYFKCNNSIIKSNRVIWHSIIGLSIFWAISQIVVAVFGAFLKSSAGVENTVIAQSLLAVGGLGIVVGSMIANKVSKNYIELGIVPLGSLGVAITLFIIPTLQNVNIIAVVFFIYGLCAGLVLVPLNALIQLSAPGSSLGRILAANNFYQNIFMLIALIATAYLSYLQFDSGDILLLAAIIATIGALWTFIKLPQSLIIYIVRFAFKLRYKINAIGVENVPTNKGTLLLGNHVSYIDWAILQIVYPQQIRFVMEKSIYKKWYLKWFLDFFKIIPISSSGSKNSLKEVAKALNDGHTVALFPEGMLTKNGGMNTFLAGYEHILKEVKDCVIVPFYLHGLWESKFSNAADKIKQSGHNIYVKFGAELPTSIKAVQLKNIVIDLSVDVWHNYINQQKDIASMWIEQIKKKNNFYVADSNSILHRNKFLAATLLMRKWLKNKLGNNNNIAVILPSTVAGAICNMSLFCLARTVVNLNYTTGIRPLKLAIKKAEIQTIITSKKFIKKLQDKGFDLSEVLNNGNIIYLEDMQKFAHKLRAIGYFLRAALYPVWLLKLLFITKVKITKTAVILFSSGSEGDPKGIMLSHKNLIANVKQVKTMLNPSLNDKIMGTLPNFHSFGLTVCTLIPQLEGIPVIYHPDPTDGYGIGKLVAESSRHRLVLILQNYWDQ
jgi:acyl-[acyl-carrier-protein]-phospholipid O-acyltransferase/long-chain-fatty-acid--[acyl-carrier-protein] ligase